MEKQTHLPLLLKVVGSIAIATIFFSCKKNLSQAGSSQKDSSQMDPLQMKTVASDYSIHINSQNQMQKITQWGHDIKHTGKAKNLTEAASQQIFKNGKFNILRVPIYSMAHNPDGSIRENYMIRMVDTDNQDNKVKWKKIPSEGEWFYFRNKTYDKYMKGFDDDAIEMTSTSNQGLRTQWKLVDIGNGWYHIESREHQKYIRGLKDDNIVLTDTSHQGSWTQWKLVEAGNGWYYLKSRGHKKYLKGGGNAYKPIIDAINRAKNNGNPDIYASHKIFDSSDHSTWRNANFGPFYKAGGIDVAGFAASIDAFIDYIYDQTGETITYLAPRCELGNHWTTNKFVQVVRNLTDPPLIVSPEAAYVTNAEDFWTAEVAEVTDVKSTHNKSKAPPWPSDAKYDWNGETVGGNNEKFQMLFYKLSESFYKGEVTGIVFWGDTHLNNTDDDNNNGPFRRELVEASAHHLVEADVSSIPDAAAIAFETAKDNQIKVFYSSVGTVEFTFNRVLEPESIPSDASDIKPKSFIVNSTGKTDYRSFTLSFKGGEK